jgi:hypothetical protein
VRIVLGALFCGKTPGVKQHLSALPRNFQATGDPPNQTNHHYSGEQEKKLAFRFQSLRGGCKLTRANTVAEQLPSPASVRQWPRSEGCSTDPTPTR